MASNCNELGHTYYPKYLYDDRGNPILENGKHKIAYSAEDELELQKKLEEFKATLNQNASNSWKK